MPRPPAPTQPAITHVLYLHGFRSSPGSAKALRMGEQVAARQPQVHWCCPQLPPSPREAATLILALTAHWPPEHMAVIGSSLGGFYARWLSLQRRCRAVLLNPAPFPQRDLARHIGEHPVWQNPQERIFFLPEYVQELASLSSDIDALSPQFPATPQRLFALISDKDEVLDSAEMRVFCEGATMRRLPEGDHAISDFDQHLDALFDFLWPPPPPHA